METNDEKKVRVTFEQPENLTNKYETGEGWLTRKPEAAGQEQETAEDFFRQTFKSDLASQQNWNSDFKHFNTFDMIEFAHKYTSQQTASLQKQVEELREENERIRKILRDMLEVDKEYRSRKVDMPMWVKSMIELALNPQDNQKEK